MHDVDVSRQYSLGLSESRGDAPHEQHSHRQHHNRHSGGTSGKRLSSFNVERKSFDQEEREEGSKGYASVLLGITTQMNGAEV
jgi:hypothetical protein